MSRSFRRPPMHPLFLVGAGFVLALLVTGSLSVGGIISGLLFLPILLLKIAFVVFLITMAFRFFGRGFGRRGDSRGGPWGGPPWMHSRRGRGRNSSEWSYRGEPMEGPVPPSPAAQDRGEWAESLRQARREVEDLDRP